MDVYNFTGETMSGRKRPLEEFRGKVSLIVNTAGQCGFTYQYKDLQELYDMYADQGFTILGFPSNQFSRQDPDEDAKIHAACLLRYGVMFPMFRKGDVRGENAPPLFQYLASQIPFQGFDEQHPTAKIVLQLLKERHPDYLQDPAGIRWNFTKFLIDPRGNVVKRYEATTELSDIERDIRALLPYVTAK